MATKRKPSSTPKSAAPKLAKGETYVGLTLHDNKPHHLILLPGDESLNWKAANEWAAKQGGVLPSRIDLLVLFQRARESFQRDWYWSAEQSADVSVCAWCQYFGDGSQHYGHKGDYCRARAVRRVPLR